MKVKSHLELIGERKKSRVTSCQISGAGLSLKESQQLIHGCSIGTVGSHFFYYTGCCHGFKHALRVLRVHGGNCHWEIGVLAQAISAHQPHHCQILCKPSRNIPDWLRCCVIFCCQPCGRLTRCEHRRHQLQQGTAVPSKVCSKMRHTRNRYVSREIKSQICGNENWHVDFRHHLKFA